MSKHLSNNEQLQALYDQIPKVACKRLCQMACGFIPVRQAELKKIRKKAQIAVDEHIINDSLAGGRIMFNADTERCPCLGSDGNCTVYEVRPFICRLFGAVEGMLCPEGCVPERVLTREEAAVLIGQLHKIK